MSNIITPELRKLRQDVAADREANRRLIDKASWEHMSAYAVLAEWGDPRTWGDRIR